MEELEEVRVIDNDNNITSLEITTNYRKMVWRIPYTIEYRERPRDEDHTEFYRYSIGVRDLCRVRNINCSEYFKFWHRDIME